MLKRSFLAAVLLVSLTGAGQAADAGPWFGTWALRDEDAGGQPETLVYSDAGDGAMRMESVEARSVIITHFDGQPVPDSGPTNSGNALAVTATSPRSYTWIFWTGGAPFVQGVNTLAEDGQSFTEISWRIDRPERRVTLIYERQ
jgi:hypothetical protein